MRSAEKNNTLYSDFNALCRAFNARAVPVFAKGTTFRHNADLRKAAPTYLKLLGLVTCHRLATSVSGRAFDRIGDMLDRHIANDVSRALTISGHVPADLHRYLPLQYLEPSSLTLAQGRGLMDFAEVIESGLKSDAYLQYAVARLLSQHGPVIVEPAAPPLATFVETRPFRS